MTLFNRYSLFALIILSMVSCNKEEQIVEIENKAVFQISQESEILNSRINYINQPIELQGAKNDLGYNLVASVESPTINGVKLSATSVTGTFGRTYVGFHTRGSGVGGELLSLDVSNPEEPIILQSAQSNEYEVNDVFYSMIDSKLWICGDTEGESSNQAYAMEFGLDSDQAHNETQNWIKLSSSHSGNSITETWMDGEVHLWFTSGVNGGLEVFPASNPNEIVLGFDAENTKHFDASMQYGVVIIGLETNLSIIRVYDLMNNASYIDYEIPYTLNSLSKHGISIDRDQLYIAMGSDGLLMMDLRNGEITGSFKTSGGTANSVFVEKDYVYVAYGSAGLFILNKINNEVLGNYQYDGSCNNVFVEHEMVYLANGDGDGFLILSKN